MWAEFVIEWSMTYQIILTVPKSRFNYPDCDNSVSHFILFKTVISYSFFVQLLFSIGYGLKPRNRIGSPV